MRRLGWIPWMAVAAVSFLAVPQRAQATSCQFPPPANGVWLPYAVPQEVPPNGALVLEATAFGDVRGTLEGRVSLTVTLDGTEVPGNLDIVMRYEDASEQHVSLVWWPDDGFQPDRVYDLVFEHDPSLDTGDVAPLATGSFAVMSSDAEPQLPQLGEAAAAAVVIPDGRRVCCMPKALDCIDASQPYCMAAAARELAIAGAPLTAAADYGTYGLAYHRALRGYDGVADEIIGWSSTASEELVATFDRHAESLCVGVQLVAYADGSVLHEDVACTSFHDFDPATEQDRDLSGFLEACNEPAYWEDDGEPFEPPSASEDGDEGGCACASRQGLGSPGPSAFGLLLLVLVGAARRTPSPRSVPSSR